MIVGIDLGTTNSLLAVYREGQVELVPNALGHVQTPSAVSVDDGDRILVGLGARERLATRPGHTATAFKRWMGTDRTLQLGSRSFRPEELSALVLRSLKEDAERFLGEPLTEAVITVPAYFNETQRRATKHAGELAGLKVERLLNEPTAAGLAYGLQEKGDHTTFLVFDLGGGTFDVSVLEYFEGVVEVRSSAGDTRLGGEDFVDVIRRIFVERVPEMTPAEKQRFRDDPALWRAAEQAKRDLSNVEHTTMRWTLDGRAIECPISRHDFEHASDALLARLRKPIERALSDARIKSSELSEIVLVGGSTRIPMVRQLVARLFGRLPLRLLNPDETIARGAALQAALKSRDAALEEIVLTDVMPYSLGIISATEVENRLVGDRFAPIIERNMPVPISRERTFVTVADLQDSIRVDVRQGESPIGSDNLKLTELEVKVPRKPSGQAGVRVRFTYDPNGLLAIDVTSLGTNEVVSCVLEQNGNVMSPEARAEAMKRIEALKMHPRDQQQNRYAIERAKRVYEDLLGGERELVSSMLARFQSVLETHDSQVVDAARQELLSMLDQFDRSFVL